MSRREHTGVHEWPPNSGRYRLDYRDAEGRRHRELIGKDKKLAIRIYNQRKDEILLGKHRVPRRERKTFGEVLAEHLECQEGMLSDYTLHNDKLKAKILEPLLGHELIDQIDAHLLVRILARIKSERFVSGGTVNRYRALLSAVFKFGLAAKYIDVNPLNSLTVKTYPEPKGRVRYLTADEEGVLRQILRQLRCRRDVYRELEFDLALFTGLRKSEQYTALWSKVDLDNKRMTVVGKSRGGIQERTIPLNAVAVDTLEKLYRVSNGSSYVIPVRKMDWGRKDRESKKDVRNWFDNAVLAAGIENFRWHDLRHTFASRAVMAGVPLKTVQEWMGHTSIRTTMIYAHLSPSHHQAELQKIVDTRKVPETDTLDFAVRQIDESKAV